VCFQIIRDKAKRPSPQQLITMMLSKKPVLFHLTKKNGSCHFVEPALEQMVNKFWELDSFEKETVITQDDALCERIFVDRHKRSKTGR
jgi:hypothetical protein